MLTRREGLERVEESDSMSGGALGVGWLGGRLAEVVVRDTQVRARSLTLADPINPPVPVPPPGCG